jgi:uncharacterized protein YciI
VPDVRFVVIHSPGPRWQPGRPVFQQAGVQEHVEHYRRLLADGKLELGGPFMDAGGGGMMIPAVGVGRDELVAFAHADPAVISGLLRVEVRDWIVGMKK